MNGSQLKELPAFLALVFASAFIACCGWWAAVEVLQHIAGQCL